MKIGETIVHTFVVALALSGAGCGDKAREADASPKAEKNAVHFERRATNGIVRVLYVVLDRDGVYFGDHRTDFLHAIPVLEELATREGVKSVMFHVTRDVKFGDAVRFYAALDKSKYFVFSFPTYPVPDGFRLPLIGTFQKQGGWWYDEVNQLELM